MASPGSFIRSAARATSSAYRRLPIRWRLAGGSALLTLVILLGFAAIVGVLTTRQIESDFNRDVEDAANELQRTVRPRLRRRGRLLPALRLPAARQGQPGPRHLRGQPERDHPARRQGRHGARTRRPNAPYLLPPREDKQEWNGYLIESRPIPRRQRGVLRPVRARAVRRQGDREPRARVPRARRARRRRAGAAGRAGHRDARDGADHAAHRHRRARSRARATRR